MSYQEFHMRSCVQITSNSKKPRLWRHIQLFLRTQLNPWASTKGRERKRRRLLRHRRLRHRHTQIVRIMTRGEVATSAGISTLKTREVVAGGGRRASLKNGFRRKAIGTGNGIRRYISPPLFNVCSCLLIVPPENHTYDRRRTSKKESPRKSETQIRTG